MFLGPGQTTVAADIHQVNVELSRSQAQQGN